MSSNSVCNHSRDKQVGLSPRGRPILLSLVWLRPELDSTQACFHYQAREKYTQIAHEYFISDQICSNWTLLMWQSAFAKTESESKILLASKITGFSF